MKGSRYKIIKLVESELFIKSMNELLKEIGASITVYDNWMPKSICYDKEAELNDFLNYNFSNQLSKDITQWWLYKDATTPNWDLISTCTINGERGLLLVEAKAHQSELENESKGKILNIKASDNSVKNDESIGEAIGKANEAIKIKFSEISLSRDKCYQLSNRVAHAWWLADQSIPVVLLYLGFLNCKDMDDGKNKLFKEDSEWQNCFRLHAEQVGVDKILEEWVETSKSKFITICRSYE